MLSGLIQRLHLARKRLRGNATLWTVGGSQGTHGRPHAGVGRVCKLHTETSQESKPNPSPTGVGNSFSKGAT